MIDLMEYGEKRLSYARQKLCLRTATDMDPLRRAACEMLILRFLYFFNRHILQCRYIPIMVTWGKASKLASGKASVFFTATCMIAKQAGQSKFFRGLFSGLIPSLIALYFIVQGLHQTASQIELLQEQISYVRMPVLEVSPIPVKSEDGLPRFTVSNVGNEPAKNVYIKYDLLLFSDSCIYSIGQRYRLRAYSADSTLTPRKKLWPRLTIFPDSQEVVAEGYIVGMLTNAYHFVSDTIDLRSDLVDLRNRLGGTYILFMELSFRRQSDFVPYADSFFFEMQFPFWFCTPLGDEIGGPAIQEQIKAYLFNGPEISVEFYKDCYKIYKHRGVYEQWEVQRINK